MNMYKCGCCLEVWFDRRGDDNVKSAEATSNGCEGERESARKEKTTDVDGCAFCQILRFPWRVFA